jgi:hypothetical protein
VNVTDLPKIMLDRGIVEPWMPALVIDLLSHDETDAAATTINWFDELPDIIVVESRVDIDVHTLDDGRVVHVYGTMDPGLKGGA